MNIIIKNKELYVEALTHNSYSNENKKERHYQRLEFLGDAVLQLNVSLYLFNKFKKANEGELSKYRSSLVKRESLAMIARKLNLGDYVRLGIGEHDSRGFDKDNILADLYESLTAAIYLDLGLESLQIWLNKTILEPNNLLACLDFKSDFKSELQELIQIDKRSDLVYKLVNQEKIDNNKILFTINCILDNMVYGIGKGLNKKQAEQNAAKDALSKIKLFK
nr:ribonuclease III [Spiroplasma tabanidicola]